MILASMVFIWLGLATLLTLALCWAASGPMPRPNAREPGGASRKIARCASARRSRGVLETPGNLLKRTEPQNQHGLCNRV